MVVWRITPGKAVGTLSFGMSRHEVAQILGDDFEQFRRTTDSPDVTSAHDRHALHLTYGDNDRLKQVTVFVPNEALIENIQLLGEPIELVRKQADKRGLRFRQVDGGLWCDSARILLISVDGTVDGVEVHSDV